MQDSIRALNKDHDYISSDGFIVDEPVGKSALLRIASKYEQSEDPYRNWNFIMPSTAEHRVSMLVSESSYLSTLQDFNHPNVSVETVFGNPGPHSFSQADDLSSGGRLWPHQSQTLLAESRHAGQYPPNALLLRNQQQSGCPTLPRLTKEGSVDDFLADEGSRRRSIKDFLCALDAPNPIIAAPAPSYAATAGSAAAAAAPPQPPPAPRPADQPTAAKKPRPSTAHSVPAVVHHGPTEGPPQASRSGAAPWPRRETAEPEAESTEERERRRREQNREAQRRFRERRKHREFQAFATRLAAATADGGVGVVGNFGAAGLAG